MIVTGQAYFTSILEAVAAPSGLLPCQDISNHLTAIPLLLGEKVGMMENLPNYGDSTLFRGMPPLERFKK